MRKNLFLTLALLLATFAGATAENWSVTLDGTIGLPGDTALNENGEKYLRFQSGIIKTDTSTNTLRFTVVGTVNNEKQNGNNIIFALSELNVYDAEMSKELTYTVTSNADHNALTQTFEGKGLMALNDGKYDKYFHSMYGSNAPVAEYHYVELTFKESFDRFVIEWGGRGEVLKNTPTVVGLTKGGVDFVPYSDRSYSFEDEKITDLETLANGAYFTIRGNAVSEYIEYDNTNGTPKSDKATEGSGPVYTKPGSANGTVEPEYAQIAKLIPVKGEDDKYYIYYPADKAYLNGDATENQFNSKENGWQYMTNDINKAAKVEFTSLDNGDFGMRYHTKKSEDTFKFDDYVYLAADPRSGKMKTFSYKRKTALELNKWCDGFGIECAFNWSIYGADYAAPAWAKEYELGTTYLNIKRLMTAIENHERLIEDGYVDNLNDIIAAFDEAYADIENMENVDEFVVEQQIELSALIYQIANAECEYMNEIFDEELEYGWIYWGDNSKYEFEDGMWDQAAYDQYILPGQEFINNFVDNSDEDNTNNYKDYINELISYFANKDSNIEAFRACKFEAMVLPKTFKPEAAATQEIKIALSKEVNGFRWTLIDNRDDAKNDAGDHFTSIIELEVFDAEGEKVTLDANLITSNATHDGDGQDIEGLVDGKSDTFWHAMYGNQTHNPGGPAYLDVQFPEGKKFNSFTIKFTNRGGQAHTWQTECVISEYNTAYDNYGEDPYQVAIGNKVTDLSQLKDGGFYVLQGNLRGNIGEESARPRFYSGNKPYNVDRATATNVACVYMFKKVDDKWNILSLNAAKYLAGAGLTLFESKADNVTIIDSENMADTWVIYNKIDTVKSSEYTHEGIEFPKKDVPVSAMVYMDWDGGMASRACYSPLPGVADPDFKDLLTDSLKVSSHCGDYLHFNKTNGEGEWTIYEATIKNEYFAYMLGLAKEVEELEFIAGVNPGCIDVEEEAIVAYNEAKAAAIVAKERRDTENAETIAKTLATAINNIGDAEVIGFEPTAVYRIESALLSFEEETGYTRSIYAGADKLAWGMTPNSFDGENYDFLFRISNDKKEFTKHRINVDESEVGKAYLLQNVGNGSYIADEWACSNRPTYIIIEHLEDCVYNIKDNKANQKPDKSDIWHADGHTYGKGRNGELVNWAGGVNSASAWTFIYVGEADDYELSVEDLVVEGDEVVSVSYFTPAGTAIPAPVKGLNIVVTVYANGVIEAKKVLVK